MAMTRKACQADLEKKLKAVTAQLKAVKEDRDRLLQEREDCEAQFLQNLGQNTTLKSQLAQLHIQYEEALEEVNRLRASLQNEEICHDSYELVLQLNRDLQQELSEYRIKLDELESKTLAPVTNYDSLDLHTQLQNSGLNLSIVDLTSPHCPTTTPVLKGRNRVKKYVKLSNFIKKSERKLKKHKQVINTARLSKDKCNLQEELNQCYNLIGRNSTELDYMAEKIVSLERSLHDITCKYKTVQKEAEAHYKKIHNYVNIISNDSSYVQVQCNSTQTDPPIADESFSFLSNEGSLQMQPAQKKIQSPVRLNSSCKTRKTVIYSDGIGSGMGLLLNDLLMQSVTNNCFTDCSISTMTSLINGDSSLDSKTSLIVQLSNVNIKRSEIIKLVEILLNKIQCGLGKLILCSLPYSKSLSEKQNRLIYNINLLMYNLTCRHCDVLFFETNNFISNCDMTKDTLYLSKKCKLTLAKLLAYNIFDPVIESITKLPDEPVRVVSNFTNEGKVISMSDNINLN